MEATLTLQRLSKSLFCYRDVNSSRSTLPNESKRRLNISHLISSNCQVRSIIQIIVCYHDRNKERLIQAMVEAVLNRNRPDYKERSYGIGLQSSNGWERMKRLTLDKYLKLCNRPDKD